MPPSARPVERVSAIDVQHHAPSPPEAAPARRSGRPGLLVGGLGVLALAGARLVLALRADRLTVLPDEVGFLGNAWLLGRGEPAPPMGFAPFYPAGQPVLLAPVAALTEGAEVLQTAARVLDVALLAGVVPVLIALLARLGRLDPGPRALAAVTASALPGLWVAAVVVWPDALAALLWPLALLALAGLARPGPLARRIWFGPAVAALWVVHARFLPVVGLAALVLVLRLLLPARTEERGPGPLRARTADALNLLLGAAVLVAGVWLNHRVQVRWTRLGLGPLDGATDDLGATARGAARSLAGQTWYALAGTAGLAGLGAVALGRLAWSAARRGRALWTEAAPLVASVAVLGWLAVALATAVQLRSPFAFGSEAVLDLVANGRYQAVVLAPLVAVGAARVLRRAPDLRAAAGVAAVTVALAGAVSLALGSDPEVLNPSSAAAVTWARGIWSAVPVAVPTVLALAAVAVASLGRPGRVRVLALVGVVLVGCSAIGIVRADDLVDRSRRPSPVSEALPRLRARTAGDPVSYVSDPDSLSRLTEVGWGLSDGGMESARPGSGREDLLLTASEAVADPERAPADTRLSATFPDAGLALWVRGGPAQERLAAEGLLYPEDPAAGVPPEARRFGVRAPEEVIATGGGAPLRIEVTHAGAGAVWPAAGRPGEQPVDLVLRAAEGASVRVPVGEVDPGGTATVEVPSSVLRATFGPGRRDLELTVGQEGLADFTADGPTPTLALEVR